MGEGEAGGWGWEVYEEACALIWLALLGSEGASRALCSRNSALAESFSTVSVRIK